MLYVTYIVITYYKSTGKFHFFWITSRLVWSTVRCPVRHPFTIRIPQILGCASGYFDDASQLQLPGPQTFTKQDSGINGWNPRYFDYHLLTPGSSCGCTLQLELRIGRLLPLFILDKRRNHGPAGRKLILIVRIKPTAATQGILIIAFQRD